MRIVFGLRGTIAADYLNSRYPNTMAFLKATAYHRELVGEHHGETVLACYAEEREQELPNGIRFQEVIPSILQAYSNKPVQGGKTVKESTEGTHHSCH